MKTAILAITYGRPELTKKTWDHNLKNGGHPFTLYHFDNLYKEDEQQRIFEYSGKYDFKEQWLAPQNYGIAVAINTMMRAAFKDGCDAVITMANDILEPQDWILKRVQAWRAIKKAGIISIPVFNSTRYPTRNCCGIDIEQGIVIGNFGIRRELYDQIGCFAEDMGTYAPLDLDYCIRASYVGFMAVYLPYMEAVDIGGNNDAEYQKGKEESLAKSWDLYNANIRRYIETGEGIYRR